jgi:hypothetical protein
MKFGIGTFALERKHLAALSHYQTRDTPPSIDSDRRTAR